MNPVSPKPLKPLMLFVKTLHGIVILLQMHITCLGKDTMSVKVQTDC